MTHTNIAIIGGGAVGTALAYSLARYSDIPQITLIEKEPWWGMVTSSPWSNAQTCHRGRIESNYGEHKTEWLKMAGGWIEGYVERHSGLAKMTRQTLLAVGDEVPTLRARYAWEHKLFPDVELYERDAIASIEPAVMEGRDPDQQVLAISSPNGYTVDYGKLAASFIEEADGRLETILKKEVTAIERAGDGYLIRMGDETITADYLVVAAGTHSLPFAHSLGVATNLIELPVAGGFFYTPRMLNGKVYTMQIEGLPFAAVHGDPDIARPDRDRYGPTAIALPILDRKIDTPAEYWASVNEFLRMIATPDKDFIGSMRTAMGILFQEPVRSFMAKNLLYLGPGKRRAFLPSIRKVVPTMRLKDVEVAKDDFGDMVGGIRPQVVDRHTKEMLMGDVTIKAPRARFKVTPSPGATACLENARDDGPEIAQELGYTFDMDAWTAAHTPSR